MVNKILTPEKSALAEERAARPIVHHLPTGFSDRFALGFGEAGHRGTLGLDTQS